MKQLIALGLILIILGAKGQDTESQAKISSITNDLKDGINQRDFTLIKPHLSKAYRYQGMAEPMASSILRQVVGQYPKIDSIKIISTQTLRSQTIVSIAIHAVNGIENKQLILDENLKLVCADIAEIQLGGHGASAKVPATSDLKEFSFTLSPTQHLIVEASVDGIKGNFIVDSGFAGSLMLNKGYYQLAHKPSSEQALGVNGQLPDYEVGKISQFKWGALVQNDLEVTSTSLEHLGQAMDVENFGGIIGAGFYQNQVLGLDYSQRKLWLSSSKDAILSQFAGSDKVAIPISMAFHLPVVECTIDGQTYRLGIDTGAQSNMLTKAFQEELEPQLLNKRTEPLQGADGKMTEVLKGRIANVDLAQRRYNMDFVFGDLFGGHHEVTLMDGLLGHSFLASQPLIIDFVEQELILLNSKALE